MRRQCLVVFAVMLAASTAHAQAPPPRADVLDAARAATAREFAESDRVPGADYVGLLLDRARETSRLLPLLVRQEDDRADEQIGATSSASGSTTLVSKGTVPKIISFAVENGAMTRSVSGTTVTFRSNLGGALGTIANRGFFQLDRQGDAALGLLKRLSVSASFDTSRGNPATPNTFTGDQQQLSQWTARLQVINNRDNQGRKAMDAWRRGLQGKLLAIAAASGDLSAAFTESSGDPRLRAWVNGTVADLMAAKRAAKQAGRSTADVEAALVDVLRGRERLLPGEAELSDATRAIVSRWDTSASEVVAERDRIRSAIQGGALVAMEYTSDRPVRAPRTSTFRLVGEVGGRVDLTGNVGATVFDGDIPFGAERQVRDLQGSAEMAFTMGSSDTVGAFVLTISGKYLHQFEDTFDDNGVMRPNTKGTTAVGQLKLTVPTKGAGIRIPLSVTWANRTDLIKEKVVRANVGVSYDLDSVFARFKP